MKILHVTPYTEACYGGPPVAISQMVRAADALGFRCDLATTITHKTTQSLAVESAIKDNAGQIRSFEVRHFRSWFYAPSLGSWLRDHVKEYDLIHLHVPFTYPFLSAARNASAGGRRFVVMPHGLLDPWSLSQKYLKKLVYYRFIEQYNLRQCAGINVTSALEEDGVSKLGYGNKTTLIRLCVEMQDISNRAYMSNGSLRLLFLSRLHPVKDLPTILAALQVLVREGCNVVLSVVGDGDPHYVRYILRRIDQLNLRRYVTLHGFLEGENKAQAYNDADLFILPSFHENFGLAVLEAMAASLPVIISDQVGISEEVKKAGAGLVVPIQRPDILANAIKKFYDDSIFWKRSVVNAYSLVKQVYSREHLVESVESFYSKAMNFKGD